MDFVIDLGEIRGPIFPAGMSDANGKLLAVEVVNALDRLALGPFGPLNDREVDRRMRLGGRIDLTRAMYSFPAILPVSFSPSKVKVASMPSPYDAQVPWNGLNKSAFALSSACKVAPPHSRPAPIESVSRNVSPIAGAIIAFRFFANNILIPRVLT